MKRQSNKIPKTASEAERFLWHALEHLCQSAKDQIEDTGKVILVGDAVGLLNSRIRDLQVEQDCQ